MLKLGAQNISDLYLGETKIERAYLGDTSVFETQAIPEYTALEYVKYTGSPELNFVGAMDSSELMKSRFVVDVMLENFESNKKGYEYIFYFACMKYNFSIQRTSNTNLKYAILETNFTTKSVTTNNRRITIDCNISEKYLSIGPTKYTTFPGNAGISYGDIGCSIFRGYPAKMNIYSIKVYVGEQILHKYAPCINGEGTPGLYDAVKGQFITSTSLVAGPPV